MHALADAQRQAKVARAQAERGVMQARHVADEAMERELDVEGLTREFPRAPGSLLANKAAPPPKRPASDWNAQVDSASGKTYYWNSKTGKTTWKAPADVGPAPADEAEDDDSADSADSDDSLGASDFVDDRDENGSLGASESASGSAVSASGNAYDSDEDEHTRERSSMERAVEAGSIAATAIEHDRNGQVTEAVACYRRAAALLRQAAPDSQQGDHFKAKAEEYLLRVEQLHAPDLGDAEQLPAAAAKPVKLSRKAVTRALKQLSEDPHEATVEVRAPHNMDYPPKIWP